MLWSVKRQAPTKETAHIREAIKREDFFRASSHFSSRERAKKSKRKITKPCYAKEFPWFLCFQFTFGRSARTRRDERFSFDRLLLFSVRISQKAWPLNVFTWLFVFELAFSRRLFRLAFRRRQTHDARTANKNFWLFFFFAIASAAQKKNMRFAFDGWSRRRKHNPPSAKRKIWVLLLFAVCIRRTEQKTQAQCAKRSNFLLGSSFFGGLHSPDGAEVASTMREAR